MQNENQDKWKEGMQWQTWKFTKYSRICEVHFEESVLKKIIQWTPDAVPTICNSEKYRKQPIFVSREELEEKIEEVNKEMEAQFHEIQQLTKVIKQLKEVLEEKHRLERKVLGVFNKNQTASLLS